MLTVCYCLVALLIVRSSNAFQAVHRRLRKPEGGSFTYTGVETCRRHANLLRHAASTEVEVVRQFEPVLDADVLCAMGGLTLLLSASAFVWWTQVVPSKRTELARSKAKGGDVRMYLDQLQEAEEDNERGLERWLFNDWLEKGSSPKPAALPFIKKAKWNSGDNPVLVAFGGIMACVIAASIAERAATVIH